MTIRSDDALQALQREVQRWLGRCLLRLQQYERLIKIIMANHEISGPAHALEAVQVERPAGTAGKTLGALVADLVGSWFVTDENDRPFTDTTDAPEDVVSFRLRMSLGMSNADFANTRRELKGLVCLRNELVHHFIDQQDLSSLDGCRDAHVALKSAYSHIDQQLTRLQEWAEQTEQCRRLAAELLQSNELRDFIVNGIAPDGAVDWAYAGIVCALREAADVLAVDGWVPVAEAGRWIADRYPEQLPKKYGCRSWRQVVHEARVFEIRRFERDGQRSACYRKRVAPAN